MMTRIVLSHKNCGDFYLELSHKKWKCFYFDLERKAKINWAHEDDFNFQGGEGKTGSGRLLKDCIVFGIGRWYDER